MVLDWLEKNVLGAVEECSTIKTVLLAVGLLYLLKLALCLACSLWCGVRTHFFGRMCSGINIAAFQWAVVTGASDGIGKGYALELAKRGVNVVLVSRSLDKLKDVEKEITSQYNITVKIIVVDFAKTDIYDYISSELSGLEIGILVNNVGVGYDHPDYFLNVSEEKLWQLINVNMASMLMMTKMVLPDMVQRRNGVIVNVSSASAFIPTPLLTVYSATKVFVDYFTTALNYEYSSKGVTIQCVLPYFVATKLSGIRKSSFFAPNARKYASDALATIGIQQRTVGTLSHALQRWVMKLMPLQLRTWIIYYILSGARKAAIRRKQKKKN